MAENESPILPYGHQLIDEADITAVVDVLKSDWLTTGPTVTAFESDVAARVGAQYGIAVASGTAALHCACQAAGLGVGDEAVIPTLTFAATAAAVRLCGAEVRFADIDPDYWGLSPETIKSALSSKTKAVLPVDFAGHPCDWDGLTAVLEEIQAITIADSAHALGGAYKGRSVGTLADMTCFSFHPVKVLTTAEGGMVVTNSEKYAQHLNQTRNHGIIHDQQSFIGGQEAFDGEVSSGTLAPWYYEVQEPGANYRISDLQCALGLSQLKKLDLFLERRKVIAALYAAAFSGSNLLQTPAVREDSESAWHIYVIRLNLSALAKTRKQVFEDLRARGIGVQVHYMPLHLHPYYSKRYGYQRGDFPNAEDYYNRALTIPLYPSMTDEDATRVIETVLDVLNGAKR
ncbi:MAG: UDP-4-amino-4,6-dideoxy-N-acetyl-beta-L-altrosamine transaminase [Rhodospirillaceae bacterium]|nr:UDP-4-amino-4,6-dideoxy-N-acetyl-beta-L-altrosamine transaminase [Rhodospirillaceae bacterium]